MVQWRGRRRSENVEDRRGRGGARKAAVGGGAGLLIALVAALVLGVDPSVLLDGGGGGGAGGPGAPAGSEAYVPSAEEDELADYVRVILADTEDRWNRIFADQGSEYREPTLVLFSGAVQSACGFADAAVGPFYCPRDGDIYLDLSFFDDLARRFGAPGDFAQAYVVAHEVGHHVQNLMGTSDRVRAAQERADRSGANALSVRLELQADCYAGIWAYHAARETRFLEEGDVEEGLNAAAAIGDDRLQRRGGGEVVPDGFTHGTSAQRVRWFRRGMQEGDPRACDTFEGGV